MKRHFSKKDIWMANEDTKRYSIVVIREMKIKTMGYHFTPTTMAVIKNTDKHWWGCRDLEPWNIAGGNVF